MLDLACVLATEPTLLLLDEPSSGIAQAEAEGLAPLLRRVRFETGCSIVIIEHDMPLISAVCDELIAFDQGRIVARGTPEVVLNDAAGRRVLPRHLRGRRQPLRERPDEPRHPTPRRPPRRPAFSWPAAATRRWGTTSAFEFDQDQAKAFGATTTAPTSSVPGGPTDTVAPPPTNAPNAAPSTTVPPAQQQVSVEVKILDGSPYFVENYVVIPVGGKIRFVNKGTATYSVVSDVGAFDSGPIAPGAVWIYDARTPGQFNYSDGGRPFAVGQFQVAA